MLSVQLPVFLTSSLRLRYVFSEIGHYPFLATPGPWLASIRGEERFKKLMERVKYEWEHFEG